MPSRRCFAAQVSRRRSVRMKHWQYWVAREWAPVWPRTGRTSCSSVAQNWRINSCVQRVVWHAAASLCSLFLLTPTYLVDHLCLLAPHWPLSHVRRRVTLDAAVRLDQFPLTSASPCLQSAMAKSFLYTICSGCHLASISYYPVTFPTIVISIIIVFACYHSPPHVDSSSNLLRAWEIMSHY